LRHSAREYLEQPFVHYVRNQPGAAHAHYFGLREAKEDLAGIAIYDRLLQPFGSRPPMTQTTWRKRELENYLCYPEVLIAYARGKEPAAKGTVDDIFELDERRKKVNAMDEAINEISAALQTLKKQSPWSDDLKASDDFLDPLFERYFEKLGRENAMRKTNYHQLAKLVPAEKIDPEISEKLDLIVETAGRAVVEEE
jgi:hypothetical protein